MRDTLRKYILPILATILVGGGIGIVIAATDTDGDGKPDTITIRVDGTDKDIAPDDKVVEVPAAKVEQAVENDVAHSGAIVDQGDTPEPSESLTGDPLPLAAQEFPGCRTQFVRNQSSRGGVTPRVIVWHYTVSRDNGWASNDALTGMANNPANGVSWHFSIGRATGTCAFNVPLSMKAWTQANANPFSVGIEVIAFGDEGVYVEGGGRARLLEVTREIGVRLGIPMQRGLVTNCQVIRPGIIRHVDLGACGGGHVDTGPFPDPIAALLPDLAAPVRVEITGEDRRACKAIVRYRQRRHGTDKATRQAARRPANERRQRDRVKRAHGRGLYCTAAGVVKRRR